jgi:hypothetical protein
MILRGGYPQIFVNLVGVSPEVMAAFRMLFRVIENLRDAIIEAINTNEVLAVSVVSVSTTSTLDGKNQTVLADATSGDITITLPAVTDRRVITVKKINGANTVTIDGAGSNTIDGVTTKALTTQYESLTLVADATEWWII